MRALLVFPATSYRPDAYVAAAGRAGIELVLATDLPGAARRLGKEHHRVDFGPRGHEVARNLGMDPVDGVVAVDERSAVVAAAIADASLCVRPYHSLAGVLAARDKRRMREALRMAGVPCPAGSADALRFPCVVKPPMLSGSQGVIRANDATELEAAAVRIRRILERHPSDLRVDPEFFELVVEDYVDGPEIAVDGLMTAGALTPIAVFDKPDPLEGPYFEETIYVTPSCLSDAAQARALEVTEAAARALGLVQGPVHAELRLGSAEPQLIEIAARSIGGLCSGVLGGSLEEVILRHAVGEQVVLRPPAGAAGVMMIPIPRSGVLRRVDGVEGARSLEGIDAVTITASIGDAVHAPPDGGSYLGFIFAHGPDPDQVTAALRRAHRELGFELSPLLELL